jgi:hypothetical protein
MNCKRYQQKILDSFAAGEAISQEVSAHQNACAVCREFYLAQQNLFHAVDAGLHSIANQPIPPSLLPRLRLRLEENPVAARASFPGWSLALLSTALVLGLFGVFALRKPSAGFTPAGSTAALQQTLAKPSGPVQASSKPRIICTEDRIKSSARENRPASPEPEVIVLAEERQAFSKYLASAAEPRDVPLMPASPVQPVSDDSQEIALVRIDSLEVPRLQGAVDK